MPGEDSEDEILRRKLNCSTGTNANTAASSETKTGSIGFHDRRNSVTFEEGFTIYRRYKGYEYSASANAGKWYRYDNGKTYPSLNQLNQSIVAGQENVWNGNWFYRENGRERSISNLRKN